MIRKLMTVVFALSLSVAGGCAGFGAGVKNALTGKEPTATEAAQTGYDVGVIVTNILLAVTGYVARAAQDKMTPKKPSGDTTVRTP